MASTTITFRVDDAEHAELVIRAEREKISLSDYIRVRLGLRGQGSQGDADVQAAPRYEVQEQLVDHERRLQALEDDSARTQAASRDARE